MIVKIDNLSHDFKGITRVNNKVTFVSDTIPGEIVDIKIVNDKKKINEGRVISYIETSDDRTNFRCPFFDRCGGCDIGYISYSKQLEYKKNIVIDIMKRYANIDINPDIVSNGKIYGYRNKITLRVNKGKLSLVESGTNNLVNIDSCMLVNDNINEVIKLLSNVNLDGVNEVVIKGIKEIMVIVRGNILEDTLINLLGNEVSSIILNDKVIYGNGYVIIDVDDIHYAVYPNSFFQVNTDMISKLYGKILDYAGRGSSLLDLYCGAGTIGIFLFSNFKRVIGIELNYDAIFGANLNKKINNIENISFECKSTSDIKEIKEDVVVVDPPRGGLDKTTINKLLIGNAKRIVYVSCNPITLARDINLLKDKYDLVDMTLFDMFPNTKHVECVCALRLR